MGNDDIRIQRELGANENVNYWQPDPPSKGDYIVRAKEVQAPFVAHWNGRKWTHPALKYGVTIYRWQR